MSIHALVINLDCSKERFDFQKQQLQVLDIHFERIPAVDSDELDEGTYAEHANNWERPLRRTEVACALSHIIAWKTILKKQLPCLILEDDALLSSYTKSILEALASRNEFDCVNFETRARRKWVSKKKSHLTGGFHLSQLIQDKSGAAAYVLWPSGAKLLLKWIDRQGVGLADATLALGPRLKHGQIEPAAAIQMDCCNHYGILSPIETSTSIHNTPKPVPSTLHPFLYRRLRGQVCIALKKLWNYRLSECVELMPHDITDLALNG